MNRGTTTQVILLIWVLLIVVACGPDLDPEAKQAYRDLPDQIDFQDVLDTLGRYLGNGSGRPTLRPQRLQSVRP